MKKHPVLAAFRDAKTDQRYTVGDTFSPRDDKQRDALIKAGCLDSEQIEVTGKAAAEMTRAEMEEAALSIAAGEIAAVGDDELRQRLIDYQQHLNDKPDALDGRTVDELKEIAAKEGVDLTGKTIKADIVAAIEAKRAA